MNEELTQQIIATAERLASAAESLEKAVGRLDAQQQALNAQVDRIVAAVDENEHESRRQLGARVAELERTNADLKAEIARHAATRKTLPPLVTALLAKTGIESQEKIDVATLDKALALLTVDQRIAVKAQMARAGIIEQHE